MNKVGFALMLAGIICMAAGAGGNDAGTCSLWISVLWCLGGMVIGHVGAKIIEYSR